MKQVDIDNTHIYQNTTPTSWRCCDAASPTVAMANMDGLDKKNNCDLQIFGVEMRGKNSRQFGRFRCLTAILGFMRSFPEQCAHLRRELGKEQKAGAGPGELARVGALSGPITR